MKQLLIILHLLAGSYGFLSAQEESFEGYIHFEQFEAHDSWFLEQDAELYNGLHEVKVYYQGVKAVLCDEGLHKRIMADLGEAYAYIVFDELQTVLRIPREILFMGADFSPYNTQMQYHFPKEKVELGEFECDLIDMSVKIAERINQNFLVVSTNEWTAPKGQSPLLFWGMQPVKGLALGFILHRTVLTSGFMPQRTYIKSSALEMGEEEVKEDIFRIPSHYEQVDCTGTPNFSRLMALSKWQNKNGKRLKEKGIHPAQDENKTYIYWKDEEWDY